jgi:phosphate transport system substrate-binding protein
MPTPSPPPQPISLTVAGSSAMLPLLGQLAEAFQAQHPEATVILLPGNSYQGVAQVLSYSAELGASSVPLSDGVWTAPVAMAGIALIVHPANPVEDLTLAQVQDILSGAVWRWLDLGIEAPENEIVVVSREWGSGTRAAFESQAMAGGTGAGEDCQPQLAIDRDANAGRRVRVESCARVPVTPMAVIMPGSAAVVAYVAQHRGAIGYVSWGHISAEVKAVRVEGHLPAAEDVAGGAYPLVQPFFLVALQEPTGAARQFVDFCLGPAGQAIVGAAYVPVR